uniref:Putative secreted protein n=1 Tax=Anopheles darlingi TaxID=43151 RepID=A0A2M4DDR6_ANODA
MGCCRVYALCFLFLSAYDDRGSPQVCPQTITIVYRTWGAFVACIVLSKEMEIFHFSDLLTRAPCRYANFGNARKEGEGNTLRSILEDDPRNRGCGIELSFSHSQPILQ